MAGTEKNTNALKWTSGSVSEALNRIEQDAHHPGTTYLNEALMNQHISHRAWSYWKKKFADDDDIMEHMALIETIFEVKLFKAALHGQLTTPIAIFALKNNHHWTDRPIVEMIKEEPKHEGIIIELSENETIRVPALKQ